MQKHGKARPHMRTTSRLSIRLCILVVALGAAFLSWRLLFPAPSPAVPALATAAQEPDRILAGPRTLTPQPGGARSTVSVALPCADGAPNQQHLPPNAVEHASSRVAEELSLKLAQSAQPHEQALSLYLSATSQGAVAEQAYRQRHPGCDEDAACATEMKAESARAQETNLQALTRLATGHADATVYGLAYAKCAAQPKEHWGAACLQINAAQWSQLAPDRLEPRISAAHEAWLSGDQTQLYLALYKVAQFDGRLAASFPAESLLVTQAMATLTEGEQALASTIVVESAQTLALDGIVSSYCSGDKLTDPNQRQLCNRLAEKMVEPGGALRQVMAGAMLGRKLGWTTERVDNARREAKAVNRYLIKELGGSNANTCGAWRTRAAIAQGIVRGGELATYRRLIPADELRADPSVHRPLVQSAQPQGALTR